MTDCGAVIVAAGLSSRMGDFKPLLPIGDESMIKRVIHMLESVGASPIVVVAGFQYETLAAHVSDSHVTVIENSRYASTKMFDSMLLGLDFLLGKCRRVLFTPVDVPLVQAGTVRALLEWDRTRSEQAGALIRPVFRGEPGHPVVLDMSLYSVLKAYSGKGGLQEAISSGYIKAWEMETEDMGITLDADTPGEYEELLHQEVLMDAGKTRVRMEFQLKLGTDELFFGRDTALFLDLIHQSGEVAAACEAMHMSCSEGWNILERMKDKLGYGILETGGGQLPDRVRLSPKAYSFLNAYKGMREEMQREAKRLFRKYFPDRAGGCE